LINEKHLKIQKQAEDEERLRKHHNIQMVSMWPCDGVLLLLLLLLIVFVNRPICQHNMSDCSSMDVLCWWWCRDVQCLLKRHQC